jgi:hypothetical protein
MNPNRRGWHHSPKLLENPEMDAPQKEKILDKVMELMEEIQEEEKGLRQFVQNKRMKSELVDAFLSAGTR